MAKLDQIPKKEVFSTPDGYFDNLAQRIQSRVEQRAAVSERFGRLAGIPQLTLFGLVMILMIGWFLLSRPDADAEQMLASIDTEQLLHYLQESDLSTDDLLEDLDAEDVVEIENSIYELELNFNADDVNEYDLDSI